MICGFRTRAMHVRGDYRNAALFVWDFTQQSPGAIVLPTGITFARASSGHTVQTGTSTLTSTGITSNNVGRIGRVLDAHSLGLFIEPARLQYSSSPTAPASLPYGTWGAITTGQTDPSGGATAADCTVNYPSVSVGRYDQTGAVSTPMTCSFWAQKGSGSGSYQLVVSNGTSIIAKGGTAGTAWARDSLTYTSFAAQSCYFLSMDNRDWTSTGGTTAGARRAVLANHQIEAGKYPTSFITTYNVTRAGERVSLDSTRAAQSTVGGRIAIYLRFRALAASTELGSGEGRLLAWAAGEVFVDPASLYLKAIDGSTYSQTANSAISWSRYDLLEFVIEVGAGKSAIRWRVNGGSTNTASFSSRDDTLGALSLSAGLDVCNNAAGAQMPCILEKLIPYVPGRTPF